MADNKRILQDLNLYCSPNSILVITIKGKLLKLTCPFTVEPRMNLHILKVEEKYQVSAVRLSDDLQMMYLIGKTLYPFQYFRICL